MFTSDFVTLYRTEKVILIGFIAYSDSWSDQLWQSESSTQFLIWYW